MNKANTLEERTITEQKGLSLPQSVLKKTEGNKKSIRYLEHKNSEIQILKTEEIWSTSHGEREK